MREAGKERMESQLEPGTRHDDRSAGADEQVSAELLAAGGQLGRATFLVVGLDEALTVVSYLPRHPSLDRPHALGRGLAEVFPDSPELLQAMRAVLQGSERTAQVTLDGHRFLAELIPIHEAVGGRVLVILIALDVLAQELRLQEVERSLAFAQLPTIVWSTDRALRITRVSGSLLRTLRLSRKPWGARVDTVFGTQTEVAQTMLDHHRHALHGQPRRFQLQEDRRTFDVTLEPLRLQGEVTGCVGCAVDITGWLAREKRLSDSERLLVQAQRIAHLGTWEWNLREDRLHWSAEMLQIFGVERRAFEGNSAAFFARIHPEDRGAHLEALRRALEEHLPYVCEHRILRGDGQIRRLITRGEVEREHGAPTRLVGICLDVTDRGDAAARNDRSRSLLRATVESTDDGVLVVDCEGRIALHNRRFSEMWGLPADDQMADQDQRVLSKVLPLLEQPEEFLAKVRTLYSDPAAESHDELRFKDGRIYERFSRPQRLGGTGEKDGEIVGRVWSFRDVTDRERLLERAVFLSDSSRLLASLEAEEAAEAVGRRALPLLGDACALELIPEDEPPRRLFTVAQGSEEVYVGDPSPSVLAGNLALCERDGRTWLAVPLRTRDTILGVLAFRARPEQRFGPDDQALATELAQRMSLSFDNARLLRRAREALRIRDEFLSVAAHELRGPATALKLVLHGLTGVLPDLQRTRMLALADRQVRHIARFVDELLDVTRLRGQRMHLELEEVDLAAVAREVAARMEEEIGRSGSALTVRADQPVVGKWDRLRLEQLVFNLVGNALKFGRGGPVSLAAWLEGGPAGSTAVLQVVDHGIGIAPSRQANIFQAFERAVSPRRYGGLGLGLYICRSIAEALGGTIDVQSEEGRGATFTVRLPRKEGA